jgi:hypothetical protein
MNPISGLFDLFEGAGVLKKEGNRYAYTVKSTGEVMKFFRKEWNDYEKLKVIMDEFSQDDIPNNADADTADDFADHKLSPADVVMQGENE